jgi:hypothetical protein
MAVTRWVLVAVIALGCTRARTEILVVTDTDYAVPDEIDEMRIVVEAPDGSTSEATADFGGGDPAPPRTLGLVHEGGRLGPFHVRATGRLRGTTVITREAEVSFVSGRTLVLRLDLLSRCEGVTCGAGESCGEDGCASIEVDDLEEWNGQIPGLRDAGMSEVDAGMDDAGNCPAETCNDADDDCDGEIDETFDLDTDAMNCGACDNPCALGNATAACEAGACVVDTCDTGWDDCDNDDANGCEADLTDPMTCGGCATQCRPPDRDCCSGSCC